jgi:hypothetical protein
MKADLRKLALRLKIIEMLKIHAVQRQLREAAFFWRRFIRPN